MQQKLNTGVEARNTMDNFFLVMLKNPPYFNYAALNRLLSVYLRSIFKKTSNYSISKKPFFILQ